MILSIFDIAAAVKGVLRQGSGGSSTGISTDSRKIAPGEVFFALKGPNFDGHRFLKDVARKGASGAVVESAEGIFDLPSSFNVITVRDTLEALGDLASHIRGLWKIPFVAISGSAGKTSTKEMVASILSRSRRVLKTEGNRNNLIGLPLTLAGLEPTHEAAVVELGISEPWEMERLVAMCRPDVAVITNIGRGHLKSLGSLEGVAKAKGALFTSLAPHGVRIVNADDPWVVKLAGDSGQAIGYSLEKDADVRVRSYSIDSSLGGVEAVYDVRGSELHVRFSSPGIANIINGAAAIAATLALGAPLKDMEEGLNAYSPVKGRMDVVRVGGVSILDDTYNANPESMASALKTLKAAKGRKVAVLGDMLELGEGSRKEHRGVGELAGTLGIDMVVSIGEWSKDLAEGAIGAGLKPESVFDFRDKASALPAIKGLLKDGDSVLIKASRGVALEHIVEGLKEALSRA